jgi:glycosyltransferase involved in cell wall biosynthesis
MSGQQGITNFGIGTLLVGMAASDEDPRASGNAQIRVAVVIPALNEEACIGDVVRRIPRDAVSRIVVADGGSKDATSLRAREAGAEVIAAGKGYGRACLAGELSAEDCDIVVFMDGDGADDPQAIREIVRPIRTGERDFVIGSRARGKRSPGSMAWHQLAAGRLAGLAMQLLYGVRFTDMCALRGIRRNALNELGMRELSYGWNLEMQMRAAANGLRILEIPVDYHCRRGGSSKVAGNLIGTVRAATRIMLTFLRVASKTKWRRLASSEPTANPIAR